MHTYRVDIIIPARDEEALLPRALDSVRRAIRFASRALRSPEQSAAVAVIAPSCVPATHPGPARLEAVVTVVADRCTDGTVEVARAGADRVIEVDAASVGEARHLGCWDRSATGGERWILCSDADSAVPEHWVFEHLRHWVDGADVVAGHVRVRDRAERDAGVLLRYESRYARDTDHVHGANLGTSGRAYAEVGGFRALGTGEDQDLVDRCRSAGLRVDSCPTAAVATSVRRGARARAGFAAYLDEMESV